MAKITMYKNVLNQNKSIIYDKTVTQSIWPRRLKTSSWCDSTCLNFKIFWNKLFYKKFRIIITINYYFSIFGIQFLGIIQSVIMLDPLLQFWGLTIDSLPKFMTNHHD
jgi:hypothetical protein